MAPAMAPAVAPGTGRAVVGETVTSGGHPVRLEHTARAELKNFIMSDKQFDTVGSTVSWPTC
jgi:hypothetical protein